jgi:hypothetical protein
MDRKDRQIDMYTDRQIGRQPENSTQAAGKDRKIGRHIGRQKDSQKDIQAER